MLGTNHRSPIETNILNRKNEREAKFRDVVDQGNAEVEIKEIGEARPKSK